MYILCTDTLTLIYGNRKYDLRARQIAKKARLLAVSVSDLHIFFPLENEFLLSSKWNPCVSSNYPPKKKEDVKKRPQSPMMFIVPVRTVSWVRQIKGIHPSFTHALSFLSCFIQPYHCHFLLGPKNLTRNIRPIHINLSKWAQISSPISLGVAFFRSSRSVPFGSLEAVISSFRNIPFRIGNDVSLHRKRKFQDTEKTWARGKKWVVNLLGS